MDRNPEIGGEVINMPLRSHYRLKVGSSHSALPLVAVLLPILVMVAVPWQIILLLRFFLIIKL